MDNKFPQQIKLRAKCISLQLTFEVYITEIIKVTVQS